MVTLARCIRSVLYSCSRRGFASTQTLEEHDRSVRQIIPQLGNLPEGNCGQSKATQKQISVNFTNGSLPTTPKEILARTVHRIGTGTRKENNGIRNFANFTRLPDEFCTPTRKIRTGIHQVRMQHSDVATAPIEDEEFIDFEEQEIYVEQREVSVPVEAVFLAQAVDLKALAQEKSLDVTFSRNHLIIKYKDPSGACESTGIPTLDCWSIHKYMVIFHYGTVVLFNFAPGKEEECLKIVKLHSKGLFEEPKRDNYCVVVKPTLEKWSEGSLDKIMVKELDTNSIRIVAVILSQSIALDHYTKQIDGMLKSFDYLNLNMQQTGTFNLKRKELFKLVATVNTALAEAILKVGLLERSDVAWQNANYDSIWAFMREEFEVEDRFEDLEFKTGIIQHNVAFFLDILQNRKSDSLEWIIIVLIAADICVSLYQIFYDM